jgi:hypothetical protein
MQSTDDLVKEILRREEKEEEESNASSEFVQFASNEISRIEESLYQLESGQTCIRNKQRKRTRLLAKKEKIKIRIQLAMRDVTQELISPSEKRTLAYYTRKFTTGESDSDFLYRVLCTELGLTLQDWFPN